jgi:hypothetical protein
MPDPGEYRPDPTEGVVSIVGTANTHVGGRGQWFMWAARASISSSATSPRAHRATLRS